MPLKSRSVRTTSLNKRGQRLRCRGCRAAKSATATRGFETPRPVPVLNQSCAAAGCAAASSIRSSGSAPTIALRPGGPVPISRDDDPSSFSFPFRSSRSTAAVAAQSYSPQRLKIEPELHRHFGPAVFAGSGFSGFELRMARTAELSTEAFPLDCKI